VPHFSFAATEEKGIAFGIFPLITLKANNTTPLSFPSQLVESILFQNQAELQVGFNL